MGNEFDTYVEGTKLSNLNGMGRIGYQESYDVVNLDQATVRPDYSIYNEQDELLAIADAKTSPKIGYDTQAHGFLQVAMQTKSRTIIYYTPAGNAKIDSQLMKAAQRAKVTILQVGVK